LSSYSTGGFSRRAGSMELRYRSSYLSMCLWRFLFSLGCPVKMLHTFVFSHAYYISYPYYPTCLTISFSEMPKTWSSSSCSVVHPKATAQLLNPLHFVTQIHIHKPSLHVRIVTTMHARVGILIYIHRNR
jgi:hypothetical protein